MLFVGNWFRSFVSRACGRVCVGVMLVGSVSPLNASHCGVNYQENTCRLKIFNIQKRLEKALAPIHALNMDSTIDEIAYEAARLKVKVDQWYCTGMQVEDIARLAYDILVEGEVELDYSFYELFVERVKEQERRVKSGKCKTLQIQVRRKKEKETPKVA